MRSFLGVKAEQPRTSRAGAEHTECRCRMPAFFIVMEVDPSPDLRFDFEPGNVCRQHIASGRIAFFSDCQQRRQDRRRRMAAEIIGAVVEVQHIRRHAIDERSVQRNCALHGSPDQRCPGTAAHNASRDRCGVLRRSGNAYAQSVEQTDLGVAQCRRTNVINFSGRYPLRQLMGNSHLSDLPV